MLGTVRNMRRCVSVHNWRMFVEFLPQLVSSSLMTHTVWIQSTISFSCVTEHFSILLLLIWCYVFWNQSFSAANVNFVFKKCLFPYRCWYVICNIHRKKIEWNLTLIITIVNHTHEYRVRHVNFLNFIEAFFIFLLLWIRIFLISLYRHFLKMNFNGKICKDSENKHLAVSKANRGFWVKVEALMHTSIPSYLMNLLQ